MRAPAAPFLERPPADTKVLLGWVKGPSHLHWIHKTGLYNLRADGRTGSVGVGSSELAADLVLLYGRSIPKVELWSLEGEPRLLLREEMIRQGYPNPGGKAYFCLRLGQTLTAPSIKGTTWEELRDVQSAVSHGGVRGAPCVTTWFKLVSEGTS